MVRKHNLSNYDLVDSVEQESINNMRIERDAVVRKAVCYRLVRLSKQAYKEPGVLKKVLDLMEEYAVCDA